MPPKIRAQRMLEDLRRQARDCRACPLWRDATQTVFGEGPPRAVMRLVGEQPGDREDRDGRPFVGPAGALLDRALAQAGIDRSQVYADTEEINACHQWLLAELDLIEPSVLVCLGATAAKALLGGTPRIARDRGRTLPTELAPLVMLTAHPRRYCASATTPPGKPLRRRSSETCVVPGKSASNEIGTRLRIGISRPAAV
jgi:uracil-DNA glycosylase family 4